MQDKIIFITVGMHRSGTSLVANCLKSMGLTLSDSLIPASKDNTDGFFEDADIVHLNECIETLLQRNHLMPSSIAKYPDGWLEYPEILNIKDQIKEYISSNIEKNNSWLIKDPRMTRLMPLYFAIFRELGIKPITIFTHRHPASVVRSKSIRDEMSAFVIEKHWLISNVTALSAISSESTPMYVVSYDDLISASELTLNRLSSFIGHFIDKESDENKVYPHIRVENALANRNHDISVQKISKEALELNAVLQKNDGYLNNKASWVDILRFIDDYSSILKTELVWTDFVDFEFQKRLELRKVTRVNEKLNIELKSSSSRVFGLLEQLNILNQKNTKTDNVALELNDMKIKYQVLNLEYKNIKLKYNALNLKQKTKIYRLAKAADKIKLLIYDRSIKLLKSRSIKAISQLKMKLIVLRRSLNNNGFKATALLIFKRLSEKRKYLFSNKRRQITIENLKKRNSEKKNGQKILLNSQYLFNEKQARILLGIFVKEFYIEHAGLKGDSSFNESLQHFVNIGIDKEISPGPLFNTKFYSDIVKIESRPGVPKFIHWLEYGVDNKIVPTALFDEAFYIYRYSLILGDDEWSFERFLTLSINNGAAPNQYFEPKWYVEHHDIQDDDDALPPLYHYLIKGYRKGWRPSPLFPSYPRDECRDMTRSPLEVLMISMGFGQYRSRLETSAIIQEQIAKIVAIEPDVLKPGGVRRLNIQPMNNPIFPAIKAIRNSLEYSQYDSIVLIPHCRYGGAGLVAGELCRALRKLDNKQSVLLIRTDNDDYMRPDWFPEDIGVLNLLDFACDMPDIHRRKILLDMLIGLKPRRIFNVHSRLGWEVFTHYSDRLKRWSSLYGYTFCYDLNVIGKKVGYPISYVPKSIEHLKQLFVDNQFLKDDLIKENELSHAFKSKVSVLYTPHQKDPGAVKTKANINKVVSTRKTIFWAGRFDRQKRFDLVIKLAKRNPDLDFWIWGAAMLSDADSEQAVPENMKLHGLFESYSDLPFEHCDLWLYTSQWDGVPTILIELGLRKVPLVASRVWGTKDLINENTSFPVDKIANLEMYESAIMHAFSDPLEVERRSENLRKLILNRHSSKCYLESLNKYFHDDVWSNG